MSDFIYSSSPRAEGELGGHLQSIYHADAPQVYEYHGSWGALAVTRNLYQGFQPLETERHVFVVIGGPVLCFSDNLFLTGDNPHAGTRRILERFEEGTMQWDKDLSGPFVILSIDKEKKTVTCITDLMLFIPVYRYMSEAGQDLNGPDLGRAPGGEQDPTGREGQELVMGTHVDAVAKAARQQEALDPVSLADFIIYHAVTFPYTTYEKLRQLHPAALHRFILQDTSGRILPSETDYYWFPEEEKGYKGIQEAARALRQGVGGYIRRVIEGMDEVAQFISAGTDSRVIAGMLPAGLKRDGYVFLDHMNREGRLAGKASGIYGVQFKPQYRNRTHYLDILPAASDLIGSGSQHIHAHSLGFHKSCRLDRYPAVFGGYSADVFLKGYYQPAKNTAGKSASVSSAAGKDRNRERSDIFWHISGSLRLAVKARRKRHQSYVQRYRPESYLEWAKFWPSSMRVALPNLGTNRRLFRTYEPFLCNEVTKVSAAIPARWKQKKRIYQLSMHPYLRQSWWLINQEGYLPYFPWWINSLPLFLVSLWRMRKKFRKKSPAASHEGPWGNWKTTMDTPEWKAWVDRCDSDHDLLRSLFDVPPGEIVSDKNLRRKQVVNLFQVAYLLTGNKTV